MDFGSQTYELSSDSWFESSGSDDEFDGQDYDTEPLSEPTRVHLDYLARSALHFSFSPIVDDWMARRCELVRDLYYPCCDSALPSSEDRVIDCKHLIQ